MNKCSVFLLAMVLFFVFNVAVFSEPVTLYFYGSALASVKKADDQAILNAKTELLKKIVDLYLDKNKYEENKSLIESEILNKPNDYVSKKLKNKKIDKITFENEKYKIAKFNADVDLDKIYNKLSSILNENISKPKVYINTMAFNNINTNDSDILESTLKDYFKKLNFDILDSSVIELSGKDPIKTLKERDCKIFVNAVAETDLRIVGHEAANLVNDIWSIINIIGKKDAPVNPEYLEYLEEISGYTYLSVCFYSLDTGMIYNNEFEGDAKGNATADNSAGVSHNSVKKSVEKFKSDFSNSTSAILTALDMNKYTVALGNLTESQSADFEKQIRAKDINLKEIVSEHKNCGNYFTIFTYSDIDTFMSYLENMYLDNQVLTVPYIEDNIIGAYIANSETGSVNGDNIMAELFDNDPYSVVKKAFVPIMNGEINNMKIRNNVIVEYTGDEEKIVIPNGVIAIGSNVFKNNKTIREIEFASTLRYIGENAFYGCSSLTELNIPGNVKYIGYYAFAACYNLNTLNFENGVLALGEGAFCCYKENPNVTMRELTIPGSIYSVGKWAFQGYPNIENLIIQKGVKEIKHGAFMSLGYTPNKILKNLTIPDTVERIEDYAFTSYSGLQNLILGFGIKKIGESAFCCYEEDPNYSLTVLDIPSSVRKIDEWAFQDFKNLRKITISKQTSYKDNTFVGCTNAKLYKY